MVLSTATPFLFTTRPKKSAPLPFSPNQRRKKRLVGLFTHRSSPVVFAEEVEGESLVHNSMLRCTYYSGRCGQLNIFNVLHLEWEKRASNALAPNILNPDPATPALPPPPFRPKARSPKKRLLGRTAPHIYWRENTVHEGRNCGKLAVFAFAFHKIPFNFNDALHMLSGKRFLLEFLVLLITPLIPFLLLLLFFTSKVSRQRETAYAPFLPHLSQALFLGIVAPEGISPMDGRAQRRTFEGNDNKRALVIKVE